MTKDSFRAIISGGASGLGEACVRRFHAEGGQVAICDLDAGRGVTVAAELGDGVLFLETDVTDGASVERAVAATSDAFGGVDVAVNCAGVVIAEKTFGKSGPASLEGFERVVRVNLVGTFNVCRVAAAAMAPNEPADTGERGVIINTASVAAFDGQIGQTAYAASKGGIASMTLPMARDLARLGIRVMTIAPGVFDTPMMAGMPEKVRAELEKLVPFPSRLGSPEEFATLVWRIVENPYLNGEVIRLDGALRMPPR